MAFFNKDSTTFEYLKEMQEMYERNPHSKSCTFVSKDFLDKILQAVKEYSLKAISSVITNECDGKFSLQIDTATDKTSSQQCSVVVRYVEKDLTIHNKIIAFLPVKGTKGVDLYKFVEEILSKIGLNIKNAIGSCTDGAGNMFGANKGFLGLLEKVNPLHISIWCVCHRFNLVIDDALKCCEIINDLIKSVSDFNGFLRGSPKRIDHWRSILKKLSEKYGNISQNIRPAQVNTTRWWSNRRLLDNLFKAASYYLLFFVNLQNINNSIIKKRIKCSTVQKKLIQEVFKEWTKDIKNIIILNSVRTILDKMHETLDYLQTSALPISEMIPSVLSCYDFLENTYNNTNDSLSILIEKGNSFANAILDELMSEDIQNLIETEYQLPSHISEEEKSEISSIVQGFIQNLKVGLETRFLKDFREHEDFYLSINALSPTELCTVAKDDDEVPISFLCRILALNYRATKREYIKFADKFKKKRQQEMRNNNFPLNEEEEKGEDEENYEDNSINDFRNEWVTLKEFFSETLNQREFQNVHMLYRFAFTLPCAQVECERSFSVMGHIKSARRSSMSNELLETYMIINSCTSDNDHILTSDIFPDIIDIIGNGSSYLRNRLIYSESE